MQHELIFVFILIFTLDSIAPGPAVAMVMSRGASIGLVRTLPFIAGLVIGDILLFIAALLGLAALAAALGPLFLVIKWLGVCYLLYLAYSTWNAEVSLLESTAVGPSGLKSFGMALLLPLGNPKAVGFYVALLPTVMDISHLTFSTALQFNVAIIVIWGSVLVFYTAVADSGRRYFNDSSMQKWLNRGAAGAMAGAAGTIAFRD